MNFVKIFKKVIVVIERSKMKIEPGTPLVKIDKINKKAISVRDKYVKRVEQGKAELVEFQTLKHKFPFYGHIECNANKISFLMYSANDDVVAWRYFWQGSYEEPVTRNWIKHSKRADIILDVGAYSGCMSIIAAINNPLCTIYALEAVPRTAERLAINTKLNKVLKQIKILPYAASDKSGEVDFYSSRDSDFLDTGGSIYRKPKWDKIYKQKISTIILDSLIDKFENRKVSCIKIDVEGHEVNVLNGMKQIVEKYRPAIFIEISENTRNDVIRYFNDHKYEGEQLLGLNWLYTPIP